MLVAKLATGRESADDESVRMGGRRGLGRCSSRTFEVLATPKLLRKKFGGEPEDEFDGRGETARVRIDGSGFSVLCEIMGAAGCLSVGGSWSW